jgi:hypothetical protein
VDLRAGLDDLGKITFLILPGLEPRPRLLVETRSVFILNILHCMWLKYVVRNIQNKYVALTVKLYKNFIIDVRFPQLSRFMS